MTGKKKNAPGGTSIKPHINNTMPEAKCHAGNQLNTKPILIDSFRGCLAHIPESTVRMIQRVSTGIVGSAGQLEYIKVIFRDGTVVQRSIRNMTPDETFISICSIIADHAALTKK